MPSPFGRPLPPFNKNPVYHQQVVSPLHLSASVLMRPGTSAGVPVQALQNPMGQDMEILEIRFEVLGDATLVPDVGNAGAPLGGSVGCDLQLGNYKVTQGAVPIWNFGRAENLSAETREEASQETIYNAYTWRLPRPLFVPAGAVLAPKFNHLGLVAGPLNVRIGYSARAVFKPPKSLCIPWVAAYKSKAFNPISAAATDSSQPQQLFNGSGEMLHLQRFTGRTMFILADGRAGEAIPYSVPARDLLVRMTDSYGRPTIRTYTPFRSVFGSVTRSWELEEVGAQIDPDAFFRVFLKKSTVTLGSASLNAAQIQAFVGMVGWREVKA